MSLPELRVRRRQPDESVEFAVQACAKYGKYREIYVPTAAVDALDTVLLIERPEIVAASAKSLARRRRELLVVDHIDHETGKLRGVLDGQRRTFTIAAIESDLRRITVQENENGVEPLAVFAGHGGQMLGPPSWYRIRCDAWERMRGHAEHRDAPLMPRRRWRWHDLRHTFALQLLSHVERQMDGDESDAVTRRRRHTAYLAGHIKHNPLLIVSRRLGVVERLAISARKSTSHSATTRTGPAAIGCPGAAAHELHEFTRNDKRADQLWLTQAGARQVDTVSSALVSRIVDKLAQSPTFEGRPDREQVEAALERIAHRVLVQRDWTDDRAELAAAR